MFSCQAGDEFPRKVEPSLWWNVGVTEDCFGRMSRCELHQCAVGLVKDCFLDRAVTELMHSVTVGPESHLAKPGFEPRDVVRLDELDEGAVGARDEEDRG